MKADTECFRLFAKRQRVVLHFSFPVAFRVVNEHDFAKWSSTRFQHGSQKYPDCAPIKIDTLPQVIVRLSRAYVAKNSSLKLRKRWCDVNTAQWKAIRLFVMRIDGYRCVYCNEPATTVDHVIPFIHFGSSHPDNCAAACVRCNSRKGSRLWCQGINNDSHS